MVGGDLAEIRHPTRLPSLPVPGDWILEDELGPETGCDFDEGLSSLEMGTSGPFSPGTHHRVPSSASSRLLLSTLLLITRRRSLCFVFLGSSSGLMPRIRDTMS